MWMAMEAGQQADITQRRPPSRQSPEQPGDCSYHPAAVSKTHKAGIDEHQHQDHRARRILCPALAYKGDAPKKHQRAGKQAAQKAKAQER